MDATRGIGLAAAVAAFAMVGAVVIGVF